MKNLNASAVVIANWVPIGEKQYQIEAKIKSMGWELRNE